jgi:hypothetical protein
MSPTSDRPASIDHTTAMQVSGIDAGQYRVRYLADNLLATLDAVVPDSTINDAVENARRALRTLSREANTIRTAEPTCWTFMGHWEDGEIVVDYAVPGTVQDDREDNAVSWPEGLWAGHGEGATGEQALADAIAFYGRDDEPEHDPDCEFGQRSHAGPCHTHTDTDLSSAPL